MLTQTELIKNDSLAIVVKPLLPSPTVMEHFQNLGEVQSFLRGRFEKYVVAVCDAFDISIDNVLAIAERIIFRSLPPQSPAAEVKKKCCFVEERGNVKTQCTRKATVKGIHCKDHEKQVGLLERKIVVNLNPFGNYEYSGFVIHKTSKKVVGTQHKDGRIIPLTDEEKVECNRIGLGVAVVTESEK